MNRNNILSKFLKLFIFITSGVQIVSGQVGYGGCPADWTQWSGNGACYKVIRLVCTWDQCEAECVRQGGHLTSIHSQAENDFVDSLTAAWAPGYEIVAPLEINGVYDFKGHWIGMHRSPVGPVSCMSKEICTAGSFMCQWSDGTPMDYGCITHSITAPVGYPWRGPPWGATRIGMPDFSWGTETCVHNYAQMRYNRDPQPWHGLWNDYTCSWQVSGGICKRPGGPAPPIPGPAPPGPNPPGPPAPQQPVCCDCAMPAMNPQSMPLGGCSQLAWIPLGLNSQPAGCLQTQGPWCLLSGLGWWQSTPYGSWLCIQPGFLVG